MEPITTIIASAIAMGAAAGIKPTVAQAVQDAYAGLKRLIRDRYGSNEEVADAVDCVTKKPEVGRRREALDDALKEAGAEQDAQLASAAKQLIQAVKDHAPQVPESIGMSIGILKAAELDVENVRAGAAGTAVKMDTADIAGRATFSGIGGGTPDRK